MTQLRGVRVIQKYQRPLDILVEIENMNRVLNADYNRRMKIKDELTNSVRVRINADATLTSMSDAELMNKVRNMTESKIAEMRLSDDDIYEMKESVIQNVYSSIRGYGILDALLEDESITEIMINGYDNIFLERDGRIVRHNESFESSEQLEDMIQKIVGKAGREVNHANPIVDTRLPDGSRVNVVLPPVALKGPTMTIRKFSKDPMSMDTLLRLGSITDEAADFLKIVRRNNPAAKIVWILPGSDVHPELAEEAVALARREGLENLFTFALPDYGPEDMGARFHPNAAYNRKVGLLLAEFLKGI